MGNKTAMQELIERLNNMVSNGGDMDLLPAIEHAPIICNFNNLQEPLKSLFKDLFNSKKWDFPLPELQPTPPFPSSKADIQN